MRTFTEKGLGYELFNETNFELIKKFLVEHLKKDRNKEFIHKLNTSKKPDDLEFALDEAPSYCIARIINNKESISLFEGFPSSESPEQIGIIPLFPWQYKDTDFISQEQAFSLLKKYADILGIKEEPDYFVHEYYI